MPDLDVDLPPSFVGYLRGVDVINHTSFTYTGQAQGFEWIKYGFKMHIPENALPPKVEECEVHIKASLSGKFQFPDDTDVISAIYWISTPHKFVHPTTIEIQHCIQISSCEDSNDLALVIAKCSQKNLPYQFKILEGGVFSPHGSYASLQLTHFSGVGAIRRQRHHTRIQKRYCAKLYYISTGIFGWNLHFVITLNLDAHISVSGCHCFHHNNFTFNVSELLCTQALVMAEVVVDFRVPHTLLASSMGTSFLRGLA